MSLSCIHAARSFAKSAPESPRTAEHRGWSVLQNGSDEEAHLPQHEGLPKGTTDDRHPCITLRTLNYGNYGIFLVMGNARFISSTVGL